MNRRVWLLRALLAGLAVTGIVLGARNGEVQTVLTKATKVCLECIGIG
ncbi:MAG: CD1871A family CXXC motif-containing protein [Candidatus Cryosericum sp.]